MYPKYPLLRTIRALLRGTWGVLAGFRVLGFRERLEAYPRVQDYRVQELRVYTV